MMAHILAYPSPFSLPMSAPTSWWFKEDTSSQPTQWTWRTIAADGGILKQSAPFKDYGQAVVDAIKHGFRPTSDYWAIETAHSIARFAHGQRSAFIPKIDRKPLAPSRSIEGQQESSPPVTKRSKRQEQ
jgi:hypothetical protein